MMFPFCGLQLNIKLNPLIEYYKHNILFTEFFFSLKYTIKNFKQYIGYTEFQNFNKKGSQGFYCCLTYR